MARQIDHRQALLMIGQGAQVVDVLPAHEYRACHIRGALHLPLARLMQEAPARLSANRPIIVYCRDAL